jgi:LysR family transcriptional regulator, regulator for bpeEF and oprC
MKTNLNALTVFARVAQLGTFTAAANSLAMPKATVSTMIAALEKDIGVRLLERSTRSVTLTEAGRLLLKSCEHIQAELDSALQRIDRMASAPSGLLRLSAPVALSRGILAPLLPDFRQRYPEVLLKLDVNTRPTNLIEDGYDIALLTGPPPNTPQIQPITMFATRLYASIDYVRRRGLPRHARDLHEHVLIGRSDQHAKLKWLMRRGKEEVTIQQTPECSVSDTDTRAAMIECGMGIGWLPEFLARQGLAEGRLLPCLHDWAPWEIELNALLPASKTCPIKVKVLIDYLREELGPKA